MDRLQPITSDMQILTKSENLMQATKSVQRAAHFSRAFFLSNATLSREKWSLKKRKISISNARTSASLKEKCGMTPLSSSINFVQKTAALAEREKKALPRSVHTYVLVWQNNHILFEEGWGKSCEGVPIDRHSIFRIGSLTKQFVAYLIRDASHKGLLDLRKNPFAYLELTSVSEDFGNITIEDLLAHSSGLPTYNNDLAPKKYAPIDLIRSATEVPLKFSVGDYFLYSNSGYSILGLILEKIFNMSFDALITKFCQKTGLLSTGYLSQHGSSHWVLGHTQHPISHEVILETGQASHQTKAYSAAGLYSCGHDLQQWFTNLLSNFLLLKPKEMLQNALPKIPFNSQSQDLVKYRDGFFVKGSRLEHTGFFPGYLSEVVLHVGYCSGMLILSGNDREDIGSLKKDLLNQFSHYFDE